MKDATILVVDDEKDIVELVSYNLRDAGFSVRKAYDGATALDILRSDHIDLVVLDLMLPQLNGLDVCRIIKSEGNPVAVLMLTARGQEEERIEGLETGADDYVVKPFSPNELVARARAILRRTAPPAAEESDEQGSQARITVDDLVIDKERYQVQLDDDTLDLTPKEFAILSELASSPGRVFSRDELLNRVWGYDYVGETRIVDVHISHLRDKLGQSRRDVGPRIETVRGFGYKLEA